MSYFAATVDGGVGDDEDIVLPAELKLTRTETCDADFTCPYSGLLLEEPCTLSCGHTYSRSSILHVIKQGGSKLCLLVASSSPYIYRDKGY